MKVQELKDYFLIMYGRELLDEDLEVMVKHFMLDKVKKYDKILLDRLVLSQIRTVEVAESILKELANGSDTNKKDSRTDGGDAKGRKKTKEPE